MNNYLQSTKELIVLEVANNHQGDFEHGKKIIDVYSEIIKEYKNIFDFAIKFQYRNLSTFIHPDFIDSDLKFVKNPFRRAHRVLGLSHFHQINADCVNAHCRKHCFFFHKRGRTRSNQLSQMPFTKSKH